MSNYRLSVIHEGMRKNVETSMEEFDFYSLLVGPYKRFIRDDGTGRLTVQGPITTSPGLQPDEVVVFSQILEVKDDIASLQGQLLQQQDELVAARLMAAQNTGIASQLAAELQYIRDNRPLEEQFVAGVGGQTMFTATLLDWDPSNSIPDIQVFLNDRRQYQGVAFNKISATQINFTETIPEGESCLIRQDWPHFIHPKPAAPFFRHYVEHPDGLTVDVPEDFDIGTGRLSVYQNGVYIANSPIVGASPDRYVESSINTIQLGVPAEDNDVFTFYDLPAAPSYKVMVAGLAGTIVTVLPYVMGSGRLRVYRNGLLMNAAGKGHDTLQYTESSPTQIILAAPLESDEYLVLEYAASAPQWRDDLDGITGVNVDFTFGNYYTQMDKKLQVFRNGRLMYDSTTVGGGDDAMNRYQENGVNSVLLETAIEPVDVITAIYL